MPAHATALTQSREGGAFFPAEMGAGLGRRTKPQA